METDAPLYFTKAYAPPARLLKAVGAYRGDAAHSPEAILVYPERDYQGDIVHPEGGDWSAFHRNPVVNFEHGPYIGIGELTMKSIPAPDPGESGMHPEPAAVDGRINVPFGVTKPYQSAADLRGLNLPRYSAAGKVIGQYSPDECLRLADRMGPLILDGTINGVSIEFTPEPSGRFHKSLGKVDGLSRDAIEFYQWKGITWANCSVPVNAKARQVLRDEQEYVRAEKCLPVFEASWADPVNGPLIRKSLTPYLESILEPPPKGRVTVATRMSAPSANGQHRKAFPPKPDEEGDDDAPKPAAAKAAAPPAKKPAPAQAAVGDDQATATDGGADTDDEDYGLGKRAAEATATVDDGMEPVPVGIDVLMTLAQGIADSSRNAVEGSKKSDNPKLRAYIAKRAALYLKWAAKDQSYADALGERLKSGGADDVPEPTGDEDDAVDAPTEPETDDEGKVVLKSFPHYRPELPFTASQVGPPVRRHPKATPAPESPAESPDLGEKLDKLLALLGAR